MPGNEQKHTFIPKAPVTGASAARAAQRAPVGLFFGITLVIFLLTVFAAAGVYAYRAYLTKEVVTLNSSLEIAKAAFEPDSIRAFKRFSGRINTADALLARHVAPSILFTVLQDLTLQSVRLLKFSYSFDSTDVQISLSGTASNYSSVAFQSNVFGKSPYIGDPVFSNLTLDKAGSVTFDVNAHVDPKLLLYESIASESSDEMGIEQ